MQTIEELSEKLLEDTTKTLKNEIEIALYVYGKQFSRKSVYKWFTLFRFFKPTRISIYKNGGKCPKRFNENVLKEAALDESTRLLGLYNTTWGIIEADFSYSSAKFAFRIPIDLWLEQKKEIINNYQEIFIELGGCFGFIVNRFDNEVIQNPRDIDIYKRFGLTDSDFPGINDIPIVSRNLKLPYPMYQMDPSYLPGHRETYGDLVFTTAPYMWFGPDFIRFFSQENLETFNDCEENVEFSIGYRRICLWDNVAEYNALKYRERQWSFLKQIEMKKVIRELKSRPFIPKDDNCKADPSIEICTGNFSHGGTLLVKYYVDEKGKGCSKSIAYACVQREMDGHTIIWQEKIRL